MKKVIEEKKKVMKENLVCIFGDEYENKKYELKEVIQIVREKFGKNLEVGKVSYYFLAFRYLKLIDVSYENLASIVIKIFELNGLVTNTTAKCMAWYNARIKKGIININGDFKSSVRIKNIIDINSLF